ncbi:MAG: UvrABC system protein B [Patescibacteria group bacterium]|nr:MAG: UvrABC system protein B [Patescibacteria group bacterium]
MFMFKLKSNFSPTGDQPKAIEKLTQGIQLGLKNQVLLGVTGSGKTFTMANVIAKLQMPALIISHNKTLSAQLYQEMREFFPNNAVSYFVSYYDYYQPEAYVPQKDLYIAKETQINELIDKLRLQTTANILSRDDVITVASVSCIYNIGSPSEYNRFIYNIKTGDSTDIFEIAEHLVKIFYIRSEFEFKRGTFRIRGNNIDIYPAYEDFGVKVERDLNNKVCSISLFDPLTGKVLKKTDQITIYPAKQYVSDPKKFNQVEQEIRQDLTKESEELKKQGKELEAKRLIQRVNYDLEMIKEIGYVNGIENYSRYFDGRKPGDPPYSLLDFYNYRYGNNWILIVDESHITIPQIRGMYEGDRSRKKNLIDFGFRLKSAYDNRPLKFDEFYPKVSHFIYVSATPDEWEINQARSEIIYLKNKNIKEKLRMIQHTGVVEQLIRPTGIVDPEIEIRPAESEIEDVVKEIKLRSKNKEKVLITTLTKKMAEDLHSYLNELGIKSYYLHSDIHTLERSDILTNLRKGKFDVLVGINLLREGLDLPEVTLVAILDADKEGFLRSKTSLIQTMGRAARNIKGKVILYADEITKSIEEAKAEIDRRRQAQIKYNKEHNITPKSIIKPIREDIIKAEDKMFLNETRSDYNTDQEYLDSIKPENLTGIDKKKIIKKLRKLMKDYAENMNFELAIMYRDKIRELEKN